MGGGLMQLVAYGAQDIYLTGNPQITFFKVVYRRHTNFAMETIPQTFSGSADFSKKVSCTIPRNGDLVGRCYLRVKLSTTAIWSRIDMRRLIKNCELEIGGQRIDKQYYQWQACWQQLSYGQSAKESLKVLTETAGLQFSSNIEQNTSSGTNSNLAGLSSSVTKNDYYYLPLDFFFCRHAGLALPLIALQYHEVKVTVELDSAANVRQNAVSPYIVWSNTTGGGAASTLTPSSGGDNSGLSAIRNLTTGTGGHCSGNMANSSVQSVATNYMTVGEIYTDAAIGSVELLVDYYYLDTDERRRFAQVSHEYLIEQVQHTGTVSLAVGSSATKNVKLNFNHPVKELVWRIEDASDTNLAYVNTAKLQLNGHDRFRALDGDYFLNVQSLQHHTGVSGVLLGSAASRARACGDYNTGGGGVYSYSFAIKPEEHQPSGTCNFSRIDNATLQLTYTVAGSARNLWVFAHGYNVLRVMSGMGGLAYSN